MKQDFTQEESVTNIAKTSPVMEESLPLRTTQPQTNLHQLDLSKKGTMSSNPRNFAVIISLVALVAGSLTGYGFWQLQNQTSLAGGNKGESGTIAQHAGEVGSIKAGDVFGSPNTEDFKDSAEGYLTIGGIEGEGSHKLQRPGGESQTVYLTSSVTDLNDFDGMEVKIWGETQKGQKAGWLMDVGRVEVVNVAGEAPIEE